jgi:CBS domain-containing protein
MKNEDVGSVPVVEDETSRKLVGIITDRDIVIGAVADGKDTRVVTVDELMSRNPVTCRPDDPIQSAFDRMSQHQVRRLPIVDGKDRVVGIIAQADIATKLDQPEKTADVVEDISQPIA